VNEGGTVIYIGDSSWPAAEQFGLPLANPVAGVPTDKFYVPGSILRVAVDDTAPLAHGLGKQADVFFNTDPTFTITGGNTTVHAVAWYADATPLRSGWAWGQGALDKTVAIVSAKVGQGNVFLFGPEILFRSQPHGNYKLFFNALYLSAAR